MKIAAALLLIACLAPAAAADRKPPPVAEASPYPCPIVRWALRTFDRATLDAMARERGIVLTPGQIKAALACEKG